MPTYTVKLILEDGAIIERISQAQDIEDAIKIALIVWIGPGDHVIEIHAHEETED